jgi:hypothetical protein
MDQVAELKRALAAAVAAKEAAVAAEEAAVAAKEAAVAEKEAAVAEKEAAVAEKEAAVAEKVAAVAEKVAAVAEKVAAAARAAKAEAAAQESEKRVFMAAMRGMAASASESSSVSADTARRGAPEAVEVSLDVFFQDWPEVPAATVEASWQNCSRLLAALEPLSVSPDQALETLPERAFVHSVLLPLLHAMTPSQEMRLWHEATLADSVPLAEAQPDVMWTHARDMSPSSLGALLCGDFKRWGSSHLPLVRPTRVWAVRQCAALTLTRACTDGAGVDSDGELLAAHCWPPRTRGG